MRALVVKVSVLCGAGVLRQQINEELPYLLLAVAMGRSILPRVKMLLVWVHPVRYGRKSIRRRAI